MFACASTDLKIFNCDENNIPFENESASYAPTDQLPIKSISWAKNNKYIAILTEGGLPEILSTNVCSMKRVQRIKAFSDALAVCFKKCTKKHLCVGTRCGNLVEYDTINKSCKLGYGKLKCDVVALDYNCNDSCLAAATIDGLITLYSTFNESAPSIYSVPNLSRTSTMQFANDDEKLLSAGSEYGEVLLWDITTEQQIVCTQSHLSKVNGTVLIDSDLIVSVGDDCKMCFYSLSTDGTIFSYNGIEPLTSVSVSSDDRTLAVSSKRGNIYFYDVRYYLQPTNVVQVCEAQIYKINYSNKVKVEDDGISGSYINSSVDSCLRLEKGDGNSSTTGTKFGLSLAEKLDYDDCCTTSSIYIDKEDEIKTSDAEEIGKIKDEIAACFNTHMVGLVRELEENTESIGNFVKEQIGNLETSFECLFAKFLEVI